MALKNSQYDILIRAYNQKQLLNRRKLNERIQTVYLAVPRIQEIDQEIASSSVKQAKELLNGNEHALRTLRSMLEELADEKSALLMRAGFSDDYMQMQYNCPACQDTGYIDGKKCHCFLQATIDMLYTQSNLKEILLAENFSEFSLQYYDDSETNPVTGKTALMNMKEIRSVCDQFVANFGTEFENLFFYGDTGIGKTFLSHCIARELLERSYSVLYLSAIELFDLFSKHTFSDDGSEEIYDMLSHITECDLLIIDDLGTELTNSFTNSKLFYCLNTRYSNKNPTIISTNLSLDRLSASYSERIFSRISSNYTLLKFYGADIRLKKKLMSKRS